MCIHDLSTLQQMYFGLMTQICIIDALRLGSELQSSGPKNDRSISGFFSDQLHSMVNSSQYETENRTCGDANVCCLWQNA